MPIFAENAEECKNGMKNEQDIKVPLGILLTRKKVDIITARERRKMHGG